MSCVCTSLCSFVR